MHLVAEIEKNRVSINRLISVCIAIRFGQSRQGDGASSKWGRTSSLSLFDSQREVVAAAWQKPPTAPSPVIVSRHAKPNQRASGVFIIIWYGRNGNKATIGNPHLGRLPRGGALFPQSSIIENRFEPQAPRKRHDNSCTIPAVFKLVFWISSPFPFLTPIKT